MDALEARLGFHPSTSESSSKNDRGKEQLQQTQSYRFEIDLTQSEDTVFVSFVDLVKDACGGKVPSNLMLKSGYISEDEQEEEEDNAKDANGDTEMNDVNDSGTGSLEENKKNNDADGAGGSTGDDFLDKLLKKYGTEEEQKSFESRKRKYIDDYDLNDPFVDDSEMYLDDVGLVKPKHDGFFAFTGDLEVIAADASDDESADDDRNRRPKIKAKVIAIPEDTDLKSKMKAKEKASALDYGVETELRAILSQTPGPTSSSYTSPSKPLTAADLLLGESTTVSSAPSTTLPSTKLSKTQNNLHSIVKSTAICTADSPNSKSKDRSQSISDSFAIGPPSNTAESKPIRVDSISSNDFMDSQEIAAERQPIKVEKDTSIEPKKKKKKAVQTGEQEPKLKKQKEKSDIGVEHVKVENAVGTAVVKTENPLEEVTEPKLPDTVLELLSEVKSLIRPDSFAVKSQFPKELKPPLFASARAFYDSTGILFHQTYYSQLQQIGLPYNQYTMNRLVYRNVIPSIRSDIQKFITGQYDTFQSKVEARVVELELQLKNKSDNGATQEGDEKEPNPTVDTTTSINQGDGIGENGDTVKVEKEDKADKGRKFKWTIDLKKLLYEICEKEIEDARLNVMLENFLNKTENKVPEMTIRKRVYTRLSTAFPVEWLDPRDFSRIYSEIKQRYKPKSGSNSASPMKEPKQTSSTTDNSNPPQQRKRKKPPTPEVVILTPSKGPISISNEANLKAHDGVSLSSSIHNQASNASLGALSDTVQSSSFPIRSDSQVSTTGVSGPSNGNLATQIPNVKNKAAKRKMSEGQEKNGQNGDVPKKKRVKKPQVKKDVAAAVGDADVSSKTSVENPQSSSLANTTSVQPPLSTGGLVTAVTLPIAKSQLQAASLPTHLQTSATSMPQNRQHPGQTASSNYPKARDVQDTIPASVATSDTKSAKAGDPDLTDVEDALSEPPTSPLSPPHQPVSKI